MTLKLANVTFDCADPLGQARFWSEALGLPIKDDANEYFAALDGGPTGPTWLFLQVPEGKTAKNRMHIDLESDDMAGEVQRLVGLGARRVAEKNEYGMTWTVLDDPEGNEFCVSGPHPAG